MWSPPKLSPNVGRPIHEQSEFQNCGPIAEEIIQQVMVEERSLWTCKVCNKVCSSRNGLKVHMRGHLGMMNYQCKVCRKGFWTKQALEGHTVQHTNVRTFNCQTCTKSFAYRQSLMRHIRNDHGVDVTADMIKNLNA